MEEGEFTIERCPSGIPGFDDLTGGGFVKNSVNAVLGGPGAGKTIFLLQFLHNGAMHYNENGLFISFEPDILEIFKDGMAMGWNFQKLDGEGKVKFMSVSPLTDTQDLKKELTKIVAKYDVKRVCFDPISMFASNEDSQSKVRMMIFDITSLLKRLKVTVILSDENMSSDMDENEDKTDSKSQYVKFLVDGVIDLYSSGLGGVSDRAVRVKKMRRTNHARGPIPMQITKNGIIIERTAKKRLF